MARRIERPSRWRDFRGVLRPTGAVIAGLALAEMAAALLGLGYEWWTSPSDAVHWGDAGGMLAIAAGTLLIGLGIQAYGRRYSHGRLTRREALLAAALIWISAAILGALPFLLLSGLNPAEAFFETMSGMTTTGATVIVDVEAQLSASLMLWRSLIQWLGGMGVIVLFVAVFPTFGVGSKRTLQGEVPGASSEALKLRITETSYTLWKLYAGLTAVLMLLLMVCGVDPFDSLCHALTTVSTGGFSTRGASIAAFDNAAVEYVVSVFMILGSLNFAVFYLVFKHRRVRVLLRSTELLVFLAIVGLATVVTTLGILHLHDQDIEQAFRSAFFQVGAFASSTGFRTDDYMNYPPPILAVLIGLMFVGGCAGSTAGGLKVERLVLLAKQSWSEVRRAFRPSVVNVVRMGRAAVSSERLSDVSAFFTLYVAVIGVGVLAVTFFEGVSLEAAFGAVLSCLANSGHGLWYASEAGGSFQVYSSGTQVFFAVVMLLGRLEIFTILALFVPDFWRR